MAATLQSGGQRASASVHDTSSALPPKYSTSGAGTAAAGRIQPRSLAPSAATTSSAIVRGDRWVVEATGCGKYTRRSCASHAIAGIPSTIAVRTTIHSIGLHIGEVSTPR